MREDDDYWFEPKRYGYGAGLPVAPQGWFLVGGYIAVLVFCGALVEWDEEIGRLAAAFVFVPATIGFLLICKARTRGGWSWRWGKKD